ncbi:MAG: PCI domain-containing protein, partial [Candidatus Helarchaeota archaeon]|nr:PCI domain-containing protein [Candidatus Helarchaeota archaeon]
FPDWIIYVIIIGGIASVAAIVILKKRKKAVPVEGIIESGNQKGQFRVTPLSFNEVRDAFKKSGKLGITEASNALHLEPNVIRKIIQQLQSSKEIDGQYTKNKEIFITTNRLEADLIDFINQEKKFQLEQAAIKLGLNDKSVLEQIEGLINRKSVNGVITKKNEFIIDELLDQELLDTIRPYRRIRISELAIQFGLFEQNMKKLIARAISRGLIKGSIDSVSNEFVKDEGIVPAPTKPVQAPVELLDVKRDYDYIGGDIRFKVALRNVTKTVVSKISVFLNVPDQFRLEKNVEKVEILNPDETRGVDFILTPLACGQGQIFGTVSYTDAFGAPHSLVVQPKEVWVKCPLVKSQKTNISEANAWRQELKKSTTTVEGTGLPRLEAFRIGCEQISALDLAEVERKEEEFRGIFSGVAKVTGDRLLVEVSMSQDSIVLDVYTSDQKQATGLLAYIRNLIKISLDVSRKLHVKSEKLGSKVLTVFQIAQGLFSLSDNCVTKAFIGDFLLIFKELLFKLNKEFPEIKYAPKIAKWLEDLSKFDENIAIPDSLAKTLEYEAIEWLKEIQSIADSTVKMYLGSFETPDQLRESKIRSGLEGIRTEIERKESNYSLRIAHYLLVIYKLSGLCLFSYKFSPGEFDPDLISGFLQAIQNFGSEFSKSQDSGMRQLSYKDFEITIEESEFIRVALVGMGKITSYLNDRLKDFVTIFSDKFREDLVKFEGCIEQFRPAEEIVKNLFGLAQPPSESNQK